MLDVPSSIDQKAEQMKCDPRKVRDFREQRGITQEKLAHDSRTGLRTIQRAERGLNIRTETVAFIAEALAVSIAQIQADETDHPNEATPQHEVMVLRRLRSGSAILDTLHKSYMCKIDCDVDPDGSNIKILKAVVGILEERSPDPLTWEGNHLFSSLVDRLDTVAGLNDNIKKLEEQGIGIYVGSYSDNVQKPDVSPYDPPHIRHGTPPSRVSLTRILLSGGGREKVVVQKEVTWPVRIWQDPDWDDDVPF